MTSPGRNDPCPCGSGRKYKRCCLEADRHVPHGPRLTGEMRREAAVRPVWEADVVPLPARIESDVAARPTAVIVVAGDLALQADMKGRVSAEAADVAREIEEVVVRAGRAVGSFPREIHVRHAEVAAALRPLLERREVEVDHRPRLPDLEAFAAGLVGSVAGVDEPRWPPVSRPESWRGWGRPDDWIDDFFAAASAYYRAEPWSWIVGQPRFEMRSPEGREWTAVVLGSADIEYGLVLCSDPEDVDGLLRPDAPGGPSPTNLEGRVLSLTFGPRHELPRRMQREVAREGWEVVHPRAYPLLLVLNTPAGGLPEADAGDLVAALRALARLVEESGEELARGEAVTWTGPSGHAMVYEGGGAGPTTAGPWEPPEELAPGGAKGPGGEPEAALGQREGGPDWPDDLLAPADRGLLEGFEAHLREEKGYGEATVRKHVTNVETFLEFLAGWAGIPVTAVHEYDLRVFLYDWYPRKVWDAATRAEAVPVSLKRFFRWLERSRGIECPWAEEVLGERDAYEERYYGCPGGPFWDPETRDWQAELYDDLEARVMLPDPGLAGGGEWGYTSGPVEARLLDELGRRWLLWRDELIRTGLALPPVLRASLVERQRAWETTPRDDLDGRTPAEAVRTEQDERDDAPSYFDPT